MIKDYSIFGERHSGTKIITSLLQNNLKLEFTVRYGVKHWYIKSLEPRPPINTTTDYSVEGDIHINSDNTLFIFVIRHPFTWVPAMFKRPYHMGNIDRSNIMNFIKDEALSFGKNHKKQWKFNEKGFYFIERHDNIIDLRNKKYEHFYNLRNHVKNFEIIKYENFLQDIRRIINKYNLPLKHDNFKSVIVNYPTYNLSNEVKKHIKDNLNNEIDEIYYGIKRKRA